MISDALKLWVGQQEKEWLTVRPRFPLEVYVWSPEVPIGELIIGNAIRFVVRTFPAVATRRWSEIGYGRWMRGHT